MRSILKKFLSFVFIMCFAFGGTARAIDFNLTTGDIGDFGAWTTEHNREELIKKVQEDLNGFQEGFEREYVETGVPVEAKLGITFMSALTHTAHILDDSLVRFVKIFLIVAFIFWVMFEAYRMIKDSKVKAMPTFEDIIKKAVTLAIWLILLGMGLPRLFGMIMGPIVAFGSYVANLILDTVAHIGAFELSDTCNAIKNYALTHMTDTSIIDAETAADIMCVPSRMSGFYYGAIKFGWQLIGHGLGTSTFTFLMGLIFVCLFTYTAFKFAFVAFGVIADLFLVIIMLPFTAIAETIQKTSYKGIAGNIYNGFLGIFKETSNLSSQVRKFIDAAIYFVALAIVVSIGGALLGSAVKLNKQTHIITILDGNFITLLMTGALVAYIAAHAEEIAKSIGGGIDAAMGTELQKDLKSWYGDRKKAAYEFLKALKDSKKS
ncbi:MAG: hypothetical protein J6Y07_02000 [Alphaproteobacteria bacterium]|nr:hypothetical protein [Alphaproteobacteria bacterium]